MCHKRELNAAPAMPVNGNRPGAGTHKRERGRTQTRVDSQIASFEPALMAPDSSS